MHPILFTIPLPKTNIPALYLYLAVIALGLIYAAAQLFAYKDKVNAGIGAAVAAAGGLLWATGGLQRLIADKDTPAGMIPIGPLPIYSYGVMLGLSLVVGWYLTLGLAKRDGLPTETMANNYVITAVAAIAGSRILYVLTNLDQFDSFMDIFALRRGGLVAYGGFLGGLIGSLVYLRQQRIPLLPWADVAVPSLASGLMITRIGCYLFGCDFGAPLCRTEASHGLSELPLCDAAGAPPGWLQKLGTFPRWASDMLHAGGGFEGSPAWTHHVTNRKFIDQDAVASLPVHPTQLYESLVGAGLLALLLWARGRQKFRGQIFLLFTFAYGVARYLIEILRDDAERGSLPFSGGKHTMVALGLAILGAGFAIGFAQTVKDIKARRAAQVLGFVPAVAFYFLLKPTSWAGDVSYQWSTSQFVGITTGFAACVAFSVLYKAALAHPEAAMRIQLPAAKGEDADDDDDNVADADEDEDGEDAADEKAENEKGEKAGKGAAKKAAPAKKPAGKGAAKADADADDEEDAGASADADADAGADADADSDEEAAPKAAKKEAAPKGKAKSASKPVKKAAAAKKPAAAPKKAVADGDGDEKAEAREDEKAEDEKAEDEKAD